MYLCLSLSLSVCLPIYLSIYLSFFLSFYLSIFLSFYLSILSYTFATSEPPKVVQNSGMPFFHIWTSKSGPDLVCFVHFDLQMCFSLQRRAIFPHPNFKKWSENVVFCTFWLENLLCATAACKFFISPLQRYLRTCRFTEPTFRPSGPTNHWKSTATRSLPNILCLSIFFTSFFWLYFSSLLFIFWLCCSALLFQLSILSEVRLLNFLWS